MAEHQPVADEEVWRLAAEFLTERYVMAVGTAGPEGPWVASVYFAGTIEEAPLRLYFLSAGHSRHGQNVAANPRVAASINEDEHDWRAIRGIQLEGTCEVVRTAREGLRAWRTYLGKFAMVRQMLRQARTNPGGMGEKLLRTQMYCLRVERLFYLDNRQGFGDRREVRIGVGSPSAERR